MIDRLFASTLTFAVLACATLAFASELWSSTPAARPVVQLERVVIIGQRAPASAPLAQAAAEQPTAQRLQ